MCFHIQCLYSPTDREDGGTELILTSATFHQLTQSLNPENLNSNQTHPENLKSRMITVSEYVIDLGIIYIICFLGGGSGARQPPVDQGLLIHKVSRSRTTYHSR